MQHVFLLKYSNTYEDSYEESLMFYLVRPDWSSFDARHTLFTLSRPNL